MKDHNDFFDDIIDVDDEADGEAAEYIDEADGFDDEADEEEDDDSTVVRTALLQKNDMLALLSLKAGDSGGQIVRFDPRQSLPSMQSYESEMEARKWFARSLATSRKNGWSVVYDGEPLVG
ncbi:MAG TPA: hypothetical protein VHU19_18240 [Pyrinomonadaceae bacterium]|jgi:hypothetical protein|nr:hypothetical protein [Pyrinomonadaceae bacterium]